MIFTICGILILSFHLSFVLFKSYFFAASYFFFWIFCNAHLISFWLKVSENTIDNYFWTRHKYSNAVSQSAVLFTTKLEVYLSMLEQSGCLGETFVSSDRNSGKDWCSNGCKTKSTTERLPHVLNACCQQPSVKSKLSSPYGFPVPWFTVVSKVSSYTPKDLNFQHEFVLGVRIQLIAELLYVCSFEVGFPSFCSF